MFPAFGRACGTAIAGALLLALLARPGGAAMPADFVEKATQRADSLRAAPASGRADGCKRLYSGMFDLSHLTRAVAAGHWDGMSAASRTALRNAIETRITRECLSLIERPHPGEPVIRRITEKGGTSKVTVQHIAADGRQSVVIWTLVPGGPLSMRALDAVADGRGLVATLRADFDGAAKGAGGNIERAIKGFAASP